MRLKTILYVVTVVVLVLGMGVVADYSPSIDPNGLRLAYSPSIDPNGLRLAHVAGLDPNGLRLAVC